MFRTVLFTVPSPVRVKPESPPLMVLMVFQLVPVQDWQTTALSGEFWKVMWETFQ
ncbi:hypothetical protein GCM10010251_42780 [Streptomyces aurantiogriseus]|uniref:Uncharacterized protein n=1 Tax=Streptomyces aurantiogriseus TaxID=66870 RepID=A0A918CHF6_9ACTN|nr:hypothetical protein GCM10010251_42780 [Streptomyces aurantiogriseus]